MALDAYFLKSFLMTPPSWSSVAVLFQIEHTYLKIPSQQTQMRENLQPCPSGSGLRRSELFPAPSVYLQIS